VTFRVNVRTFRRAVVTLLLAVGVNSGAVVARAQAPPESTAERLFREGRAAAKQGNSSEACRLFRESFTLDEANGTLLNLALCEEKSARLKSALEYFGRFLERAAPEDDRRPLAIRRVTELERRIPRVTLTLKAGSPDLTTVQLDGEDVKSSLGKPLALDPGRHQLVVVDETGATRSASFNLAEGESLTQPLEATRMLSSGTPPSARERGRAPARPRTRPADPSLGIALIGAGFGALVASIPATALVLEKKNIVEEHCNGNRCDPQGIAATESGPTWSTVSTVAVATGLVGIAAGTILLLVGGSGNEGRQPGAGKPARAAVRVGLTPSGAGWAVGGAF
jgi:hypothetical protein